MLWLLLYALLGKGFAYAGVAPFFVGEALLLGATSVTFTTGRISSLARTPIGAVFVLFTVWQAACTLPYLSTYGLDSLRDGVIWAYAVFAWSIAACTLRLRGFLTLKVLPNYELFARLFPIMGPIALFSSLFLSDWLPTWPNTEVTIPLIKTGEYCTHLAGILAFSWAGLSKGGLLIFLVVADTVLGFGGRSGLLSFLASGALMMLLKPQLRRLLMLVTLGLIVLVSMGTFDLRFVIPGTTREFSLTQLKENSLSLLGPSERLDLEGTKRWRLEWWNKIWSYTVEGDYFWMGKGYGVNLADSDGFQVDMREESLRSPHNSHLTFLARSGVPGFCLWIALQAIWMFQMLRAYRTALEVDAIAWSRMFAWLLGYWFAFIVSATFDVFLEGPMAGIPFWTLYGLGWGSHTLFRSQLPVSRGANVTSTSRSFAHAN